MLDKYKNKNNEIIYVVIDDTREPVPEVKSYMKHCKDVLCLSLNTRNAYCLELNRFLEWLNSMKITLQEVNLAVMLKYKKHIRINKNIKISTMNRSMCIISEFLRYYYSFINPNSIDSSTEFVDKVIKINTKNMLYGITESQRIFKNLLTEKAEPIKEKEILTQDEIVEIIKSCSNYRDKVILELLVATGARIGEIISLTIDCIDIGNSTITIRDIYTDELEHRLKTNAAAREIPISVYTLNSLISYISEQSRYVDSNFIFTKITGPNKEEAIDYNVIDSLFKRIRKKTKISRLTPHLIRTTTLTMWREAGMSEAVLHTLAGHKKYATTNKYYIKLTPSQKREALENIRKIQKLYIE